MRIVNTDVRRPVPERGPVVNLLSRTLVRMQDIEFRSAIAAIHVSRARARTMGMWGTGQFTRLSALAALDQGDVRAWRGSLLEDYELGLQLLLAGHRTAFCPDVWVDQQGLTGLRHYLARRTWWSRGVMQCLGYLPRAWNNPMVTRAGAVGIAYHLVQPWLTLLVTVILPLLLIVVAVAQAGGAATTGGFLGIGGWATVLLGLLLGAAPFWPRGPLYRRRCAPEASRIAALGWGLAYPLYAWCVYLTSWQAAYRIVRGQRRRASARGLTDRLRRPHDVAGPPVAVRDLPEPGIPEPAGLNSLGDPAATSWWRRPVAAAVAAPPVSRGERQLVTGAPAIPQPPPAEPEPARPITRAVAPAAILERLPPPVAVLTTTEAEWDAWRRGILVAEAEAPIDDVVDHVDHVDATSGRAEGRTRTRPAIGTGCGGGSWTPCGRPARPSRPPRPPDGWPCPRDPSPGPTPSGTGGAGASWSRSGHRPRPGSDWPPGPR